MCVKIAFVVQDGPVSIGRLKLQLFFIVRKNSKGKMIISNGCGYQRGLATCTHLGVKNQHFFPVNIFPHVTIPPQLGSIARRRCVRATGGSRVPFSFCCSYALEKNIATLLAPLAKTTLLVAFDYLCA